MNRQQGLRTPYVPLEQVGNEIIYPLWKHLSANLYAGKQFPSRSAAQFLWESADAPQRCFGNESIGSAAHETGALVPSLV